MRKEGLPDYRKELTALKEESVLLCGNTDDSQLDTERDEEAKLLRCHTETVWDQMQ